MKTSDNRYTKLKAPFPDKAYSSDRSRGFELTTIGAYYVIERLNAVFGLCGTAWKFEVKEWLRIDNEVIVIGDLHYDLDTEKPKSVTCVGGKKIVKQNYTDGYKSAMTNAICKGASFLGVGIDIYKGDKDRQNNNNPKKDSPQDSTPKDDDNITPERKFLQLQAKVGKFASEKQIKSSESTKIIHRAAEIKKKDGYAAANDFLEDQIEKIEILTQTGGD